MPVRTLILRANGDDARIERLRFPEQLERVRVWSRFERKKIKQFSALDIEALRAVLAQRDRMQAALRQVEGYLCKNWGWQADDMEEFFRAAIHPQTPES